MPANWWTRSRHYFWYMAREFTAAPMALWLLWLLFEIKTAPDLSSANYRPHSSTAFVIFSVIVLLFSVYHSVTFLSLSGLIIRIKVFDRSLPSRMITLAMFGTWAVASVVIGFVLIWFAR
jgi:fumarate reductase subunit C